MSMALSTVAEVEADDQASETLEPATDALEEQGDSSPANVLVLPLTERLLGGAAREKLTFKSNLMKFRPIPYGFDKFDPNGHVLCILDEFDKIYLILTN